MSDIKKVFSGHNPGIKDVNGMSLSLDRKYVEVGGNMYPVGGSSSTFNDAEFGIQRPVGTESVKIGDDVYIVHDNMGFQEPSLPSDSQFIRPKDD